MNQPTLNLETIIYIFATAGAMNQKLYQMIELQSKQIEVLKKLLGKQPRPSKEDKRIIARLADQIEQCILALSEHIVTIDSIRRWYRELIARTYTAKNRGRPPLTNEQIDLILQLALENPTWGEDTIAQRMSELGHDVSDRAVGNKLRKLGVPPSPERSTGVSNWLAFIEAHFPGIIAIDFATWEVPDVATNKTIRHHAFYTIRLATREVRLLGVTHHADGQWATQCIRELTAMFDNPFMEGVTHIIMDNDPLFIKPLKTCFESFGIEVKHTSKGQPWMNGYIERFIGTTRYDLRDWFIPISTEHLRTTLKAHADYYNQVRTHRSTENNRPPTPTHDTFSKNDGKIIKHSFLGNKLNYYTREAI